MISTPADDLRRHWPQKGIYLFIPGGWQMRMPELAVDEDYRQKCIRFFMRQGATRAEAQADALIQSTGIVGFKASLLSSVFYFCKMYCTMYPERMTLAPKQRKTFIAVGYEPEVVQALHVPVRYPGKIGIQQAKKALMEMRI